ncbi:hypothetical protein FQN52_001940 [Onygenales sp. PD_12]|nr:hypothetical protein FQN52_001940 [Onygenales sp. PD_12]
MEHLPKMHLPSILALLLGHSFTITITITAAAPGPKCCCDSYAQYDLIGREEVTANCQSLWEEADVGNEDVDYCEIDYCLEQQGNVNLPYLGRCLQAGLKCSEYF